MTINKLKMSSKISFIYVVLFAFALSVSSCGTDNDEKNSKEIEDAIDSEIDSSAATIVQFNNSLFSIPSPYEIAFLVKQQNIDFNKDFLNPVNRSHNYVNNFKKALNLGVYGADLGYLNIYEQTPDAVSYFSAIKVLSQELDIANAFNKKTISRIEHNMGDKDSLLYILSSTYREADIYLKENNRSELGVLILTGGWLESVNVLVNIAKSEKNATIIRRIGEQKYPLENMIKILSPYYNESQEYGKLIESLIELAYDFDGIDVHYTYKKPETFANKKLTVISSKSEIVMSDEQLTMISDKITAIRNSIIE
jgi:hypothetical protein